MRKSDKKIDNQLTNALMDVCEKVLKEFNGFDWLTHVVNYANFPASLKVICVFETNEQLNSFTAENNPQLISSLIQKKLFEININIKSSQVLFDTEENCQSINNGNWADRLAK